MFFTAGTPLFVLPMLYELIAGKPARESEPITQPTIPEMTEQKQDGGQVS